MKKTTWWILDPKGTKIGYTQDFVFAVELEKNGFKIVQEDREDVSVYNQSIIHGIILGMGY